MTEKNCQPKLLLKEYKFVIRPEAGCLLNTKDIIVYRLISHPASGQISFR